MSICNFTNINSDFNDQLLFISETIYKRLSINKSVFIYLDAKSIIDLIEITRLISTKALGIKTVTSLNPTTASHSEL